MTFTKAALLFTAITLSGCGLFKKSTDTDLPYVQLDTIETIAPQPVLKEYQASATRINDIIHTKLDVSFDYAKQYLYGKATHTIKPYFYPVYTLSLDARGMEIKEVSLMKEEYVPAGWDNKKDPSGNYERNVERKMVKSPLKFTHANNVLDITLDKEYKNTEQYIIFIDYIAKPNELGKSGGSAAINDDKGLYFINPDGKDPKKPIQIWTQGETQSSSVWYPTIDRPNERMSQEIYMTVDKNYVTLSNGELCSSSDNGDGTRTDWWKQDLPIAPYLTMMTVGDYAVVKDNKWRGKEVNYYVEKEYEAHAKAIFGNTPEMLEFFSNKLGVEYPWNKYSQIVVRDYVSGAMENVSATLHGEFLQQTDRELLDSDHEDVISHELFHQWFGDLVTCESWSNIPLNESFATYGEYLWEEYKYGRDAADYHSWDSREGYFKESQRKQVDLIRFEYDDKEDMFDAHSYNKGGQVLHMLRKYVGDDAFFASLKLYLETNKFTSVEIHNLRLAFEKVTGEDLNWFFNQWFLSAGHPDIIIYTEYNANTKKQRVSIHQVQDLSSTPLFRIPMYVDLYFGKTVRREKIDMTKVDQSWEFDAEVKPDLVNVDADKMLLCEKDEKKTIKEWAFQYMNAPLYLDRLEGLMEMHKNAKDSLATVTIINALSDKYYGLRYEAILSLKDIGAGHEAVIKEKLTGLAKSDEKADVRASAIEYLSSNYKDADLIPLYKNSLNDRSYGVIGSALSAVSRSDSEEGLRVAKQYETDKSINLLYAVADVYANYGKDEHAEFFINSEEKFSGFSKIGFIQQYGNFLKNGKKIETVNAGVAVLERIAKDPEGIKWVNYYAKKTIRELGKMYEEFAEFTEQKIKTQKEANPSASTQQLETQLANAKEQGLKIKEIYNTIK